jgi:hypothetical protein
VREHPARGDHVLAERPDSFTSPVSLFRQRIVDANCTRRVVIIINRGARGDARVPRVVRVPRVGQALAGRKLLHPDLHNHLRNYRCVH